MLKCLPLFKTDRKLLCCLGKVRKFTPFFLSCYLCHAFNCPYSHNCTTLLLLSFYKSFPCIFLIIIIFFFPVMVANTPFKVLHFLWVDEEGSTCPPFFTRNAALLWPIRPRFVQESYMLLPCLTAIL